MVKTPHEVLVEKSLDTLVDKAQEVSDIAKKLRTDADKQQTIVDSQHVGAHKLEKIGSALKKDAAAIAEDLKSEEK